VSSEAIGIYGRADQSQPEATEMLCLEAVHVGLFKAGSENKRGECAKLTSYAIGLSKILSPDIVNVNKIRISIRTY
jgi:hypothetical protein